eukprot:sb/3465747/
MWGIPVMSKKIRERTNHLVAHLLDSDYTVVGLQEVFASWHAKLIQEKVQSIFGHSHWFRSGISGSPGLLVLSRYPIIEIAFSPFPLNGYPQRITHGDWWAGKGVGLCRIDHPLTTLDVYITHIHANYTHVGYDMYTGHRISQMRGMGQFVTQSPPQNAILALGDFNCMEDEVATEIFLQTSGLSDSYREVHPDAINDRGYTNDVAECLWKSDKSADTSKRIDYIFFNKSKLTCTNSVVTLGKIPGENYSYSDHMGVVSTFQINETGDLAVPRRSPLIKSTVEEALICVERSLIQALQDVKHKVILWVIIMLLWCVVVGAGVMEVVSGATALVIGSGIAATASAVFWYLVIFTRMEIHKLRQVKSEFEILAKYSR